jgi:phosphatidylglycerol:prolipoprotein diacylglycerol transferase
VNALVLPWFELPAIELPLPNDAALPIQPFGLLALLGIAIGGKVASRFAVRNGIDDASARDLATHMIVAGLIASPLLNAAFYHPSWFVTVWSDPSFPGLSSFGGFAGSVVGLVVWRWRRRLPIADPGDALAFAFPFAWTFCRLGCFVAHDHPGVESTFFLAVDDYYGLGVPRHDLGLYEALWALGTSIVFLVLAQKQRRRGFYIAMLFLLYAPIRFGLDFLRAGDDFSNGDARYLGLTPGHYGSLVLFAIGAAIAWWVFGRAPLPSKHA